MLMSFSGFGRGRRYTPVDRHPCVQLYGCHKMLPAAGANPAAFYFSQITFRYGRQINHVPCLERRNDRQTLPEGAT